MERDEKPADVGSGPILFTLKRDQKSTRQNRKDKKIHTEDWSSGENKQSSTKTNQTQKRGTPNLTHHTSVKAKLNCIFK